MSLVDNYQSVKEQIVNLQDLKKNYNEANQLREFSDALAEFDRRISEQFENVQLFREECKLNKLPSTSIQTQLITNLSLRFAAKPNRQSIVKGKDWVRLGEEVDLFVKQVGSTLQKAWKEFCDNAFLGQTPGELKNTIALTDQNASLLAIYEATHKEFIVFSKQFPKESHDFDKIRQLGINLKAILAQMDTNVPEEVKRFFDNVNLYGGASLDLLTTTVINWLTEHSSIGSYKIIRRSGNH